MWLNRLVDSRIWYSHVQVDFSKHEVIEGIDELEYGPVLFTN